METPTNNKYPTITEALSNIDLDLTIGDTVYYLKDNEIGKTFVDSLQVEYDLYSELDKKGIAVILEDGSLKYLEVLTSICFSNGLSTTSVDCYSKDRDILAQKVLEHIKTL